MIRLVQLLRGALGALLRCIVKLSVMELAA